MQLLTKYIFLDFSTGTLETKMSSAGAVAGTASTIGQNICPGGSVYFKLLPNYGGIFDLKIVGIE